MVVYSMSTAVHWIPVVGRRRVQLRVCMYSRTVDHACSTAVCRYKTRLTNDLTFNTHPQPPHNTQHTQSCILYSHAEHRHGKNFREISRMCLRPLKDVLSHYFLHKHHLRRSTAPAARGRGGAFGQAFGGASFGVGGVGGAGGVGGVGGVGGGGGSAGGGGVDLNACRECMVQCDVGSAAECSRQTCASLTCGKCLAGLHPGQTVDNVRKNPRWKCSQCHRIGSRGADLDVAHSQYVFPRGLVHELGSTVKGGRGCGGSSENIASYTRF